MPSPTGPCVCREVCNAGVGAPPAQPAAVAGPAAERGRNRDQTGRPVADQATSKCYAGVEVGELERGGTVRGRSAGEMGLLHG